MRDEPEGMRDSAAFVHDCLRGVGASVRTVEWKGAYPYILGNVGDGGFTLLHFNHYDVAVEPQAPDGEWSTPPFEPSVRDGRLYARGASDDKAALMSRIHACDAFVAAGGRIPLQVKFLIEGKATLGEPTLGAFVEAHDDWVRADRVLWENSYSDDAGRPVLNLGEKGLLYVELRCTRLARDLSSQKAVLLPQAAAAMARVVSELTRTPDGSHIPGFLDGVLPWDESTVAAFGEGSLSLDLLALRAGIRRDQLLTRQGSPAVAVRSVPSIVVSWIHAGPPVGAISLGLPWQAAAAVEISLVPNQDPEVALAAVLRFVAAKQIDGIETRVLRRGAPQSTAPDDPFVQMVAHSAATAYGADPILEPSSMWIGTRSIVASRGMPVVGIGIARSDSNPDGPDENIVVEDYRLALRHLTLLMQRLARSSA